MERFVIGAAILAAVAIAAGGYFGHAVSDNDGFRFEINGRHDGGVVAVKGAGAPTTTPAARFGADELEIRNTVAILKVIPEDRTDVSVEIANPGTLATPTVRNDGDRVVVDGGLGSRRIHNCRSAGGDHVVDVRGVGAVSTAQMPVITARVPRQVKLSVGGAVRSEVGPSAAAELSFSGCGDTTVGDVAGKLEVDNSGSGNVTAGASGSAAFSNAGSGDSSIGPVAQGLEVSLAGSGDLTAASVNGPVEVSIAGSGDVIVNGGSMGDADISIAGSGGVTLGGDVQRLDVSIAGSGDVEVRGKAASVDANIMGSGDVNVAAVTGGVEKAVMGSGSVQVGQ